MGQQVRPCSTTLVAPRNHMYLKGGPVPGIPRLMFDAVFYLYPSESAAKADDKPGASGFFTFVNSTYGGLPADSGHCYAVTNAHVVEEFCIYARINASAGGFVVLPLTVDKWIFHPNRDDVAVCPLDLNSFDIRRTTIPEEMFITEQVIISEMISPGDEAFFIGRYANHAGHPRIRRQLD